MNKRNGTVEKLLQKLKNEIDAYEDDLTACYSKSINQKEISLLENHLNITIPRNLNIFITTLGTIDTSYGGVFGMYDSFDTMIKEEALIFEVFREQRLLGLPENYYIIDDMDDEGYAILDCTKKDVEDAPVGWWEQGFGVNFDKDGYYFPSFKSYLEHLVKKLIEDDLGFK